MGQFCCNTCRNTIFLLVILFASCLSQDVRGNEGTCSRPAAVANANLRSKYRNTEEFTEGSEVEYDCNIGYSITGRSRNRKCLKSGNWSSVEFECELIRCTYLPHPDNGRRTDANNGAGETTRFSCNPGYTLKGPSQLICRTDGEWSPRYTPKCEPILCPELLAPRNGDIFQDTSDGVRNNYESIVQYTCNYGYTINGTTSRTINRRCEADGTWDGYNYFCDTLKCEHIEFYGGTLNYFGSTHRAEGTYVYYSCHEGYTMFPSGVDYSECMRTSLRWKPDPPKCHGNCRLQDYQPIDKSLVRRQKDGERKNVELADSVDIIHGEKIIVSCKYPSSYELCVRPNDQVLCTDDTLSDNFDITCTNGTFDKVNTDTRISCQERRCDVTSHMATQTHACYWKDDDQDGQCRRYRFKVDSQSSINIKCKEGYELQETLSSSYQNVVSSKMKCITGKFSTEYSCPPKRCDLSILPYNENTLLINRRKRVSPKTLIDHGTEIEYRCQNDDAYELYVSSTNKYPTHFSATCSFGGFNITNQNFPLCQEKRCDVTFRMATHANSCYWTDDDKDGQCRRYSFEVYSRSSTNIKCDEGYELYETKTSRNQNVVSSKMNCMKGKFSTEYSCLPKRCDVSNLPYNENTIRKYDNTIRKQHITHIEHDTEITYNCKDDGYELYVNSSDTFLSKFTSKCSYGKLNESNERFPICIEKRCEYQPTTATAGVCFLSKGIDGPCAENHFFVPSRSIVSIKCNDKFKLNKDGNEQMEGTSKDVTCIRGKFLEDIKCIPESSWTSFKNSFKGKINEGRKYVSELFGRFSISISNFMSSKDSCLLDNIGNGRKVSGVDTANIVKHDSKVIVSCEHGYLLNGSSENTCRNGEWTKSFPICNPKPCSKMFQDGEIVRHGSNIISRPTGTSKTYTHGTKLNIECASGYTMETKSQVSESMTTECVLGLWSPHLTCIPKSCTVPAVSNADLKSKCSTYCNHTDEVQFKCNTGYHFEQDFIKGKKDLQTYANLSSTCEFGNWSKPIPERCYPDGCKLSILAGSRYYIYENNTNNEKLEIVLIPHGTNVSTECITGFDMVKEKDDSLADDLIPQVTCSHGSWKNVHLCMKRCSAINSSTVTNSSDDNVTLDFRHGEKVKIKCITGDIEATCHNGTLNGYDKCQNNEDNYLDNSTDSKHDPANTGCEIPRHPLFKIYDTEGGQELDPRTSIENGATVFVQCSYTYNYDDNYPSTSIRCLNGVLEKENFCPDPFRMEHKCELKNGQVSEKWLDEVLVSCDDGYLLNLIEKHKTCECKATGLDCKSVPNPPTCVPEDCKFPEKYDSGLTIYLPINESDVGLSRKSEVKHGDSVYFKCSYSETEHFEPDYTRLECMKGKWLKVATNEEWLNSNSSNFPQCSKAICLPPCQNGGKCVGDNTCKCHPQSTGKRCEKVECDLECHENGGQCIAPGKCGQCPDGKSGTNCQDKGCPRPVNVPIKHPKDIYTIGETIDSAHFACPPNHVLMPMKGMSCSTRGWNEIAECKPIIKYVIQIKTGSDFSAGTYASVYVYLHGEKYSTQKLFVRGSYGRDTLNEDTVRAVDVTPIRNITVGRDRFPDDLQVDFVSIYVDFDDDRTTADDQFYNFDADPDIWIDSVDQHDQRITMSVWPEQCVHTFHLERVYPLFDTMTKDQNFGLGKGDDVSERTCKQLCVKHKMCNGAYYWQLDKTCWGFKETSSKFFEKRSYGNFFRRSCLK